MNKIARNKTPEQMIEAIFALDLDPIKFKLMDRKEGHGWARAQADRIELEYRRYLALLARFPDATIVPNTEVDRFWHGHILDTMKYAEDCDHIFGYFLHHFPYFGMRDEEDAANLADAAAETRRLYEQEFGAAAEAAASYCAVAGALNAGAGDAAYCARAQSGAVAGMAPDAAYCARASASYCARAAASYCARASGKAVSDDGADAAYCARALSDTAAYCARATGRDIVTGKGRPVLAPTTT